MYLLKKSDTSDSASGSKTTRGKGQRGTQISAKSNLLYPESQQSIYHSGVTDLHFIKITDSCVENGPEEID